MIADQIDWERLNVAELKALFDGVHGEIQRRANVAVASLLPPDADDETTEEENELHEQAAAGS